MAKEETPMSKTWRLLSGVIILAVLVGIYVDDFNVSPEAIKSNTETNSQE
jgi:hypothetical protein